MEQSKAMEYDSLKASSDVLKLRNIYIIIIIIIIIFCMFASLLQVLLRAPDDGL